MCNLIQLINGFSIFVVVFFVNLCYYQDITERYICCFVMRDNSFVSFISERIVKVLQVGSEERE